MIKRLTQHSNSLSLVVDRPIFDLLKIIADTQLEISTDGHRLTIAPAARPTARQERVQTVLKTANNRFGKALKKFTE